MGTKASRVLFATAACLLWLNGCESSSRLGDLFQSNADSTQASRGSAPEAEPATTGSLRQGAADAGPETGAKGSAKGKRSSGKDGEDELALGKKHFDAGNFTSAERHFRRAVELHPRDLEAWLGLAASYDRLRRFELADRAYDQAVKIAGPTAEILNNRGYSYILRGDAKRARETLLEAQGKDPGNTYIKNNLELLEASLRKGKATQ
jgi:Flp pilus assembly protein TadD